jgi:hypothetical protein
MFYVLFVCKCVLPPGVNPIAVDKYINIDNFYKPITKSSNRPQYFSAKKAISGAGSTSMKHFLKYNLGA